MEHATMNHRVRWSNIEACLDSRHVNWRKRVETFKQVGAVEDRSEGRVWSDDQVFEAVLRAVLSSNTVWSKVERVLADLSELFDNFSLEAYAGHSTTEIDNRFVPWFQGRKAGSMSLRGGLVNLARAARILLRHSDRHGSADDYFTSLVHQCAGDPKQAAIRLGSEGEHKLPSLGVALAAEALKNLGYDVAKPDRHLMRAVGSFGLVRFNRWKPADGRWGSPKSQSGKKLLQVMTVVEQIADTAERPVVFVDNAIWLLCARDEVHLTNAELAEIAHKAGLPHVPAQGLGDDRCSGGETIDPPPEPGGPPRRTTSEERASVVPRLPRSPAPGSGEDPDYSVCTDWDKAREETRTLFCDLKTLVDQLGEVRTDPVKTGVSFKCMAAAGNRRQVIAHVNLTVGSGLRVLIHEDLVRGMPLEDGLTRPWPGGPYREIDIRDREHIRRAEPLLHAAYDSLSGSASYMES